jgi:hypothetical protein
MTAEDHGLTRRMWRPLAAANADLPWPGEPHLALLHAINVLREQRGDGHIAALQVAGLDPCEALVSFAAIGAAPADVFASRGWSPAEWSAARDRLAARGGSMRRAGQPNAAGKAGTRSDGAPTGWPTPMAGAGRRACPPAGRTDRPPPQRRLRLRAAPAPIHPGHSRLYQHPPPAPEPTGGAATATPPMQTRTAPGLA